MARNLEIAGMNEQMDMRLKHAHRCHKYAHFHRYRVDRDYQTTYYMLDVWDGKNLRDRKDERTDKC